MKHCTPKPQTVTQLKSYIPMRTQYTRQTLYVDYAAYQPPEKQTTTTNQQSNKHATITPANIWVAAGQCWDTVEGCVCSV